MIHESCNEKTIEEAMKNAIEYNCEKFIFENRLYRIEPKPVLCGYVKDDNIGNLDYKQEGLFNIKDEIIAMIYPELIHEYKIVPIKIEDDVLHIAISNKQNLYVLDTLKFLLNCKIKTVVFEEEEIDKAIEKYYGMCESNYMCELDYNKTLIG